MPSIGRPPSRDDLWRALDERECERSGTPVAIHFSAERREFLKLAAASLALAGGACSPPIEQIVPSVRSAEGAVPGVPRYFATAMTLGGYATGVLVESNMGRPTKIEGNPAHPASLGATDVHAQAAI